MTTYSSYIERIKVRQEENYSDICESVYIVFIRSDNDMNFSIGKDIELSPPDYNNFIQFSNLTQQQVLQWVETTPEYAEMKEFVDNSYTKYMEKRNAIKTLSG